MKKVLLLSLLAVGLCFGDDSVAAHEQQMNQMREQTGQGSMNQEKKQERVKTKNMYEGSNASSNSESGKKYKGSKDTSTNSFGGAKGGGGRM